MGTGSGGDALQWPGWGRRGRAFSPEASRTYHAFKGPVCLPRGASTGALGRTPRHGARPLGRRADETPASLRGSVALTRAVPNCPSPRSCGLRLQS